MNWTRTSSCFTVVIAMSIVDGVPSAYHVRPMPVQSWMHREKCSAFDLSRVQP